MKLLLFDFDGVLVDSLDVYEKTVTQCLAKINHPLKRGREEFLELFDGNFYEMLAQKGVDLDQFMTASVDILSQVDYTRIKPFEAMWPVLQELKKKHCRSSFLPTILPPSGRHCACMALKIFFRKYSVPISCSVKKIKCSMP